MTHRILSFLASIFISSFVLAQIPKAPEKKDGEGQFSQLIIRGVTLINGNGAPPIGPVDIVIEKNRIVQVAGAGSPGMPPSKNRPKLKEGGKELNCEGMYALPGFVDMHEHIGGTGQGSV